MIIIYCTLFGQIIGPASAISVIQHSLHGGVCNIAPHVITVIVLAFLTQENKAGKMLHQLKHRKGCAVHNNGTCGVVSIDHTPHTIIARAALLPCFN